VLEYAHALIEIYGWNRQAKDEIASSETTGFGLHDSIGEACTRLSGVAGASPSASTKDWIVFDEHGAHRQLRDEATEAVMSVANEGRTNAWPDDKAYENASRRTKAQVLDVLTRAREAVASE